MIDREPTLTELFVKNPRADLEQSLRDREPSMFGIAREMKRLIIESKGRGRYPTVNGKRGDLNGSLSNNQLDRILTRHGAKS